MPQQPDRRSVVCTVAPFFLILSLIGGATSASAQQGPASITGRVIDAVTGNGLSDVGVQVVGTTLGVQSGVDGRYTIKNVSAGTLTIQARRIGFAAKTVTGLMATSGRTLELDITLQPASLRLSAQVVTAESERGSVSSSLDQQRTATGVVNSVTREQIAKSPDSDAAQAVQRVSGVTVQDGKYVFVRGLGERYTTASLNGSRIPSPEPEKKVVPLDLFPASLLQSVTTSKTFTPDQPGDFSGAQVDIRTREFPADRQLTFSVTTGYNGVQTGRRVPFAPGAGGESYAMASASRDLPGDLRQAGNLQSGVTQRDVNGFINSFRNVWRAPVRAAGPTKSFSGTLGGSDPLFGHAVGYVVSGTYSQGDEARDGQIRALANPGPVAGSTTEINRFEGSTGRSSVLWGGLVNVSTLLGTHTRLSLTNTYNRTADNDARVERGSLENQGIPVAIERLQYVERSIRSTQLSAQHEIGRHHFDWAATTSGVTRREPDRSELVQQIDQGANGGEVLRWYNLNEGAVRTFASLDEQSYEARANYQWELGAPQRAHRLKVGGLFRSTHRDADNRAYNIFGRNLPDSIRALPPETLFGGRFTGPDSSVLELAPLGQGGSYTARDRLGAGFAMADVGLSERLRLVGGARVEKSGITVDAASTLGTPTSVTKALTDVLPSLALNVRLTDAQNLRFSATRTLARPEYREVTDITSREVLNGVSVRGNPALVRTLIDNYDVRWELYPGSGEVLSLGVFAKHFQNPIEQVYRPSSNESFTTFVNAESAENLGVELELRKSLSFVTGALRPLTIFTNATLIGSQIHLGNSEAASTNADRRMVGQAPYVINAGLTYSSERRPASATLLYNRVGSRLVAAGERPLPDVTDHARDVLDFSLRFPVLGRMNARFDAKNLLDARYWVTQGTVTREAYRAGRAVQVGLSWTQ